MRAPIVTLLLVLATCSFALAKEQRPNIILVMADDLGWGQVGFYDHPDLETPHLDAMAANGLRFDRFYAGAPVCSPTRASVLTGRSNDRTGALSHGYALRRQEKTIAHALAKVGYHTAHFGKWHLNGHRGPGAPLLEDDPFHPGHFGYQHWLATSNFFDRDPMLSRQGKFESFQGDSSEIVVDQALQFIEKRDDAKKPFFTTLWFGTPHSPFVSDDQDALPYAQFKEDKKNQYGEIIAMDRSIGALRSGLRKLGLAKNTLVWFCSDNGGLKQMGPETTNGLRGFKGDIYEGGLRVPAVIEWPAVIDQSRVSLEPAATMDIFSTIASIVGLASNEMSQPQDGTSLHKIIYGKSFKRSKPIPFRHIGRGAWLDRNYKLLTLDHQKSEYELYDLSLDPAESKNLIDSQPAVAKRMIKAFEAWSAAVDRSAQGRDYPEGRLTSPDPEPVYWVDTPQYAPYLEKWRKRPEYGYWIQRYENRKK